MNSNIGIKILVADDDRTIRDGLSNPLDSQDGLRVVVIAENGQEVFVRLQAHLVDLVLLDVDMPVMNSTEAARKLKLEYPDITIVMLAIFEYVESLEQALDAGARGFLTRDVPVAEIAKLVCKVYSGQQVMGTRFIQILTESYAQTQQDHEQYRDFIAAMDNPSEHPRPTFCLLLQALTNKSIARKLQLRDSTVRPYVSDILEHAGCVTHGELAIIAAKTGIRE